MQNGKICSYLGFCIRSGKIAFGIDAIESLKKGVYLLLIGEDLSERSKKNAFALREKFQCDLIVVKSGELGEALNRPAVKAAAVREKNLAAAILREAERLGTMKIYSGGSI